MSGLVTLYHGTSARNAADLLEHGFDPARWRAGPNGGRRGLLYLTNDPENAGWYAERFDDGVVLEIEVAVEDLIVDPEDGVGETVEEEMAGPLPACLATRKAIGPERFNRLASVPGAGECGLS